MNDVKLTDFTAEELKVLYVTIGMRLTMNGVSDHDRDILQKFLTQIVYAGAMNKVKENITDN